TTTISFATSSLVFNLDGIGDFDIQDNGSSVLFINDSGNVDIAGPLGVTGTTTLATTTLAKATVSGDIDVSGLLGVIGTSTLATTTIAKLTVSGDTTLSGALDVTGLVGLATTTIDNAAITNTLTANLGLVIASSTPATTTLALYNNAGILYWNGSTVDSGNAHERTVTFDETITAGDVIKIINNGGEKAKKILGAIGSSIDIGATNVFESANAAYISAASISNDKVVIGYQDSGNFSYGTAVVGTVSGTSISFGTPVVFESATTMYISAASIGNDKVVIAYRDNGNSSFGTAIVGTVSGTSISFGTPVVFESAEANYVSAASISNDKVVIAYRDAGNSSFGTAVVISISSDLQDSVGIA
ncbi:hypothetical protein LCGC14_3032870, partial [marine sediment metagenome]